MLINLRLTDTREHIQIILRRSRGISKFEEVDCCAEGKHLKNGRFTRRTKSVCTYINIYIHNAQQARQLRAEMHFLRRMHACMAHCCSSHFLCPHIENGASIRASDVGMEYFSFFFLLLLPPKNYFSIVSFPLVVTTNYHTL